MKKQNPNLKKDCPICGSKNVIKKTKMSTNTIVSPGGGKTLGGYTIVHEGGDWNYDHAKKCSGLKFARHPEDLLRFYCGDDAVVNYTNFFKYQDYIDAFKKIGVYLKKENFSTFNNKPKFGLQFNFNLKSDEFRCKISLIHKQKKILEIINKTPAKAFSDLKHILICGEILKVGQKKFQMSERIDPDLVLFEEIK
jgi:hypothetical protein